MIARPASPASAISRKLKTFTRLPWFVILWFAPVWVALALASTAIALVPFRRLHKLFGRSLGAVALVPVIDAGQQRRAADIALTIRLAARHAPFRSDCFPTAIVAQLLCRLYRVPSTLHLGASISSETGKAPLSAHAWVSSGAISVSGGSGNFSRYATVGCWAGYRL